MTWRCSCGNVQSFSCLNCLKCGGSKSSGESLSRLKGDWLCCKCGKNNFASRTYCFNFKCSSNQGTLVYGTTMVQDENVAPSAKRFKKSAKSQVLEVKGDNNNTLPPEDINKQSANTENKEEEIEEDDDAVLLAQI